MYIGKSVCVLCAFICVCGGGGAFTNRHVKFCVIPLVRVANGKMVIKCKKFKPYQDLAAIAMLSLFLLNHHYSIMR